MRFVSLAVLGFLALTLLTGCGKGGWFRDRSEDYQEVQSYPKLQIPSGINAEPFSKEFEVYSQ